MATVVYLPKREPSAQSALGEITGSLAGRYFVQREQQQEMQRKLGNLSAWMEKVKAAPDMNAALSLLPEFTKSLAEDLSDVQMALKVIETYHKKDDTPVGVTAYGPAGESRTFYVPKSQLPKLNDPEFAAAFLGPGWALENVPRAEYFERTPAGEIRSLGIHPVSKRPEGGATREELALAAEERREGRRERETQVRERALDIQQMRLENAIAHQNLTLARIAGREDREERDRMRRDLNAANGVLMNLLNVKRSIDARGSIILDFEGDQKKQQAFARAVEILPTLIKDHDPNTAASMALKAAEREIGITRDQPPAPKLPELPNEGRTIRDRKQKQQHFNFMNEAERDLSVSRAVDIVVQNPSLRDRVISRLKEAGFPQAYIRRFERLVEERKKK